MAINKNFVIKNGVEVNTNLLVGDSTLNMVGIGTTIPGYDLHVGRGAGARGGIGATDLTVTGITTLGVGASASGALSVTGISTFEGEILAQGGITARTAKVTDLTSTRVLLAGTGGEIEDNPNLTFTGGLFTVADNVSIGGSINVSGVGTFQSIAIGETTIVDRNFQLKSIASLDATTTATIEAAIVSGPNIFDDLEITGFSTFVGLGTFESGVWVAGIGTFENDVHFHGSAGVTTVTWDKSADALKFNDNAKAQFGTGQDLSIYHDGTHSRIADASTLRLQSADIKLLNSTAGEAMLQATEDGSVDLYYDNTKTFETSPQGVIVSGVTTSNRVYVTGVSTLTSVGSNLIPDADGTRNIGAATSEWGDLFIDGTANIDALVADTAQVSDLTNTRVVYAGASGELSDDSTLTFNSTTKVLSVQELVGVHTSAGGGGVGIASTTAHVGYGFTYIQFKGPGVSTVYASSTTGIATIFFQGGGTAGAAGTWSPEGSIGVSTSKSVGVNTTSLSDVDLQGIGNTFQGLYIGNGMVVTDNQLNGNHYIGTAYNGLMAGPVTVNGVLTVDGNWAVV